MLKENNVPTSQIREQMLVPDLNVFTLKFKIPQQPIKKDYNMKIKFFPPPKKLIYLYAMHFNFLVLNLQCFQNK